MLANPSSLYTRPQFPLNSSFLLPNCRCKLSHSRNFNLPPASRNSRFCSFLSRKHTKRFRFGALEEQEVSETDFTDGPQFFPDTVSVKIPFGDREILVETGYMGRQASGAVTVTDGETIVYTTVCLDDIPSEPSDFFPLSVNYQERFSAAGRTSGGFFKREGRAKDHEVLICRLIDRPLRPTMLKGFYHETQVLSWVVRQLAKAEMEERRLKGLCYNCDELYMRGHRCKKLFRLRWSKMKLKQLWKKP